MESLLISASQAARITGVSSAKLLMVILNLFLDHHCYSHIPLGDVCLSGFLKLTNEKFIYIYIYLVQLVVWKYVCTPGTTKWI
jgi:hypothetical protein